MKKGCLITSVGLFIIILIAGIAGGDEESKESVAATDTTTADVTSELETIESGWEYTTQEDEMSDNKTKIAYITSDNSEEFDFPYNGGSNMTLSVRRSPQYGLDVYLRISKGQFNCNEYNGTDKISVRFDKNPAMTFKTTTADDGSSDVLFLNNVKKFIAGAKKAQTIKIQASFYQEGNRVFTFTANKPLNWD